MCAVRKVALAGRMSDGDRSLTSLTAFVSSCKILPLERTLSVQRSMSSRLDGISPPRALTWSASRRCENGSYVPRRTMPRVRRSRPDQAAAPTTRLLVSHGWVALPSAVSSPKALIDFSGAQVTRDFQAATDRATRRARRLLICRRSASTSSPNVQRLEENGGNLYSVLLLFCFSCFPIPFLFPNAVFKKF